METKLCVNCKLFAKHGRGWFRPGCRKYPSLVDGGVNDHWKSSPALMREDGPSTAKRLGSCGIEGRFFEPKEI